MTLAFLTLDEAFADPDELADVVLEVVEGTRDKASLTDWINGHLSPSR